MENENLSDYKSFDDWFKDFEIEIKKLGYNTDKFPLDKYEHEHYYESGSTPNYAAADYLLNEH